MKCPHCTVEIFPSWQTQPIQQDIDTKKAKDNAYWKMRSAICPACSKAIILLGMGPGNIADEVWNDSARLVHPKSSSRPPLSRDVPEIFAKDYREAVAVLADSPKASAALSRRCLQNLIREKAGIRRKDLATFW